MTGKIIFVSGIDTDVGKTVATGMYAKNLIAQGFSVITQKMIQTGCQTLSEDIVTHRKMMDIPLTEEDLSGLTCRYLFAHPCSPHLAAKLEIREISTALIAQDAQNLAQKYDYVLLEGAGGLCVPYDATHTTLDFVREQGYPLILVTSGKLGSINHTLLSLMACRQQGIALHTLIYNQYPLGDPIIHADTQAYLQDYVASHFPAATFETLPILD